MQFPLKKQPSLLKTTRLPAKPVTPPEPAPKRAQAKRAAPQPRPLPALMEEINGREYIVLRMPVNKTNPALSRTEKSLLVGTSRGRRRVYKIENGVLTPYRIDGAHVCCIGTAYVVLHERHEGHENTDPSESVE